MHENYKLQLSTLINGLNSTLPNFMYRSKNIVLSAHSYLFMLHADLMYYAERQIASSLGSVCSNLF